VREAIGKRGGFVGGGCFGGGLWVGGGGCWGKKRKTAAAPGKRREETGLSTPHSFLFERSELHPCSTEGKKHLRERLQRLKRGTSRRSYREKGRTPHSKKKKGNETALSAERERASHDDSVGRKGTRMVFRRKRDSPSALRKEEGELARARKRREKAL